MKRALPKLRPLCEADIPEVLALEASAFESGWPPTAFERELRANALAHYLVLDVPDVNGRTQLAGFAGLWTVADQAHVVTVAVAPGLRRLGYARLLVHGLMRLARSLGMTSATLEVRPTNAPARSLYRMYGFYEVGERKRYYYDGEDAVIMSTEDFDSVEFSERFAQLHQEIARRFPGVNLD